MIKPQHILIAIFFMNMFHAMYAGGTISHLLRKSNLQQEAIPDKRNALTPEHVEIEMNLYAIEQELLKHLQNLKITKNMLNAKGITKRSVFKVGVEYHLNKHLHNEKLFPIFTQYIQQHEVQNNDMLHNKLYECLQKTVANFVNIQCKTCDLEHDDTSSDEEL